MTQILSSLNSFLLQELKGNIRVFCRVRPLLSDEDLGTEPKVYSYPTTAETLGRGIDVIQNGISLFLY